MLLKHFFNKLRAQNEYRKHIFESPLPAHFRDQNTIASKTGRRKTTDGRLLVNNVYRHRMIKIYIHIYINHPIYRNVVHFIISLTVIATNNPIGAWNCHCLTDQTSNQPTDGHLGWWGSNAFNNFWNMTQSSRAWKMYTNLLS